MLRETISAPMSVPKTFPQTFVSGATLGVGWAVTSVGCPGLSVILRSVQSCGMLVTDLYHFLDLPEDTPGPHVRLAQHLGNIVRAATAGDAGIRLDERAAMPTCLASRDRPM